MIFNLLKKDFECFSKINLVGKENAFTFAAHSEKRSVVLKKNGLQKWFIETGLKKFLKLNLADKNKGFTFAPR